jgi:hypothetical protein
MQFRFLWDTAAATSTACNRIGVEFVGKPGSDGDSVYVDRDSNAERGGRRIRI